MRIVFFGTPQFAVPTLEMLAKEHQVVMVVAQPDRPVGRGMKVRSPEVVVRARELDLPVVQPARIRDPQFLEQVRAALPDVGIVVAYGRILPPALLEIPRNGFLNVHGSVLPRWRGAAPIQRAIEAGDRFTGVTIMRVDEELDHGPCLATETTEIGPDEHTPAVAARLSAIGAEAMGEVLRDLEIGLVSETPQDHDRATFAPKIEKAEGAVTFAEPERVIYDRFRAFDPWPGIFVETAGEAIRLSGIRRAAGSGAPRTVLGLGETVTVAAGEGAIEIVEMQRPGKGRAPAGAVARGLGWRAGEPIP